MGIYVEMKIMNNNEITIIKGYKYLYPRNDIIGIFIKFDISTALNKTLLMTPSRAIDKGKAIIIEIEATKTLEYKYEDKTSSLLAPKANMIAIVLLSSEYEEKEIIPTIKIVPNIDMMRKISIPIEQALTNSKQAFVLSLPNDVIDKWSLLSLHISSR